SADLDAVRLALGEAGERLDADDGALVELLEVSGPHVGQRRLQAGDHLHEDRADALAAGPNVDARGADALAEEALLGALERVEIGGALRHRARARHPVVLLVDVALGV